MSAAIPAPNVCTHRALTHVINEEEGGAASTAYKCENCKELFTVTFAPLTIKVAFGTNLQ